MNMRVFRPSAMEIEGYAKIENEIERNIEEYPAEYVVKEPINEGYDRNEDQLCPEVLWLHQLYKVVFEIIGFFSQFGNESDLFIGAVLFVEKDDDERYRGPQEAHKRLCQSNAFGFRARDRVADRQ